MSDALRSRWEAIASKLSTQRSLGLVFDCVLYRKYTEAHRRYHGLTHIAACLDMLDRFVPADVANRSAIELAIWFHDVVYDTRRGDNEARSRLLLLDVCGQCWDAQQVQVAYRMIGLTTHTPREEGNDIADEDKYLLDVDLSILGADEEAFARYEQGIRDEYVWVSEDVYRVKRAEVLRSFMEREHVFETPVFRSTFETMARANLARAITSLSHTRVMS